MRNVWYNDLIGIFRIRVASVIHEQFQVPLSLVTLELKVPEVLFENADDERRVDPLSVLRRPLQSRYIQSVPVGHIPSSSLRSSPWVKMGFKSILAQVVPYVGPSDGECNDEREFLNDEGSS